MKSSPPSTLHQAALRCPPGDADTLRDDLLRYFHYTLGRDHLESTRNDLFQAFALSVRDRLAALANRTRHAAEGSRRTCYLSLEFLQGRALGNALLNLDLEDAAASALAGISVDLETLAQMEHDAGLGNGGLGRLAACFLDSCASLSLPVMGYGIRYQYGMFRQSIVDGHQVELPDHWLQDGHPWELERRELAQRIHFGGRSEHYTGTDGRRRSRWVDTGDVLAIAYDVPIPGYRNGVVNTLRLWAAEGTGEFNLAEFNAGSYPEAVAAKNAAENITMVLYPNDASENGRELRLRQQYFLASASLKDTLRHWCARHGSDFRAFAQAHCFQLNDTHPSIAVAELMRLLMDEHDLEWDDAWAIVTSTMAYTNHTLLPEALERWPVHMFAGLLPRLLEIIFEINARFLIEVAGRWPGDTGRMQRMSIVDNSGEPGLRMAHLAIVGSFSINGVAALHSKLLCEGLFRDFHELWPSRFNNKTNGVTPRRWLAACNPELATLITETVGSGWETDLSRLQGLLQHAGTPQFQQRWHDIRHHNKRRLAELVQDQCGVTFDADSLFEVQVKRIHEYKRQLLSVLHVIHLYARIKRGETGSWTPRSVLIGGKAAPGYVRAKLIIKLINNVAAVVNSDPDTQGRLRFAFVPDYKVSTMEVICAGADLSTQISTAGKEASGTGNMKLMMNGAITIGTLDGANIEILEEVGEDSFFSFGLDAIQVMELRGHYDPAGCVAQDGRLADVVALLRSGHFNQFEPGIFDPILDDLLSPQDPWMTAADFASFADAQEEVAGAYRDKARWLRMSIANTARSGRFSSDRTIADYNRDIWKLTAMPMDQVPVPG